MTWRQHRIGVEGAVATLTVDSVSLLAGLTAATRATLESFIAEYRAFIMRERSWRRNWSRPEQGIDVALSFVNEDMKGAFAAWTVNGRLSQLAVLLPGVDSIAERLLLARLRPSLPLPHLPPDAALVVPPERPAVLVIPAAAVEPPVRPVLQTDLLTLPAAFFALAAEADQLLRSLGG